MTNDNSTFLLFPLGAITLTRSVAALCGRPYINLCLFRHQCGDWGTTNEEGDHVNDEAILTGERILSTYPIDPAKPSRGFANTFWIITERDRSVTTVCLPLEY